MAKALAARAKKTAKKTAAKAVRPSAHGGGSLKGARKERRPLSENKLTHVVLSSSEAKGRLAFSTPANRKAIADILNDRSDQFGVTVESVEARAGRLHIVLTFKNRLKFQGFLRTITALIARRVTGAKKGNPFGRKFWDHIAFTRSIETADGAVEEYEEASTTSK